LGTGDNSPDHCVLLRFFDNPTESQLTVITQLVSGWTLRDPALRKNAHSNLRE
jgi:hypothetical protein